MSPHEVRVVLLVDDDGPDEALAFARSILESAGGSEVEGKGEFGFVLVAAKAAQP